MPAARAGGRAYPRVTHVELLLLQWYGLSDEGPEAAADDRLSFRRFVGIPRPRACPTTARSGASASGWAKRGPAERVLAGIDRQLDGRGLIIRRGTPDRRGAGIVEAAVRPPRGGAGEVAPRDRSRRGLDEEENGRSRFGYKGHAAADEGSGLVRRAVMTPADVHDGVKGDDLVCR